MFLNLSTTSIQKFVLLQQAIVKKICLAGVVVEHMLNCISYMINAGFIVVCLSQHSVMATREALLQCILDA